MNDALLRTKLFIPALRPNLVYRSQLVERLNQGVQQGCKLTLVSAPPGFGKTTFVSSWLQQQAQPAAWLSLDEEDNSPNRFFFYIIAALQTIDQALGKTGIKLLQLPQPSPIDTLLTLLINDLSTLPKQVLLVLDDYHIINNLEIHQALTFLLNHQPPQLHLIIISREDPVLPLHRLRGSGQMTGIHVQDLRFTTEEAAQFLNETMGIDLVPDEVAVLERRTEGWVAGLQLAALSMQDAANIRKFLADFAGDDRYISDYLIGEVIEGQPTHVQEFLLKSAIVDRFSAPLCEALLKIGEQETEIGDPEKMLSSRAIIDRLDQANLFIISLDNKREWYRYHNLFADFLRLRLRDLPADEIAEIHHRAADWYEENGLLAEAIEHALASEDFEHSARLIEQNAMTTIFGHAQWGTLIQWIEALPAELVRSRLQLSLQYAWALFTIGRWESVDPVLRAVEASINATEITDANRFLLGQVVTLRSWLAFEKDEMLLCTNLAQKALELLPEDALMTRSMAILAQGVAQFWSGQIHNSRPILQQAVDAGLAAGNVAVTLLAMGCQVQVEAMLGNLRKASEIYDRAIKVGTIDGVARLSPAGYVCVQMGDIFHEWNQLKEAISLLQEGIQLCRQAGMPENLIDGQIKLARVLLADGYEEDAEEQISQADKSIQEWIHLGGNTQFVVIRPALILRARYLLAKGDIAKTADWLEENGIQLDGAIARENVIEYLLLARVLIGKKHFSEAKLLLQRVLPLVESSEGSRALIEARILLSIAEQADGDRDQALRTLSQALKLAEPEGYMRLFIDEGDILADLLSDVLHSGEMKEYAITILTAIQEERERRFEGSQELLSGQIESSKHELLKPLSEQEQRILQLIAAGLSNRQIAAELFLSVNTIKTYASRIYSKLGVHKRAKAVDRAHELGLL